MLTKYKSKKETMQAHTPSRSSKRNQKKERRYIKEKKKQASLVRKTRDKKLKQQQQLVVRGCVFYEEGARFMSRYRVTTVSDRTLVSGDRTTYSAADFL